MLRSPRRFSFGFDRFSGLYLGALFIVLFGFWVPHLFLSTSTLHSVASNQAIIGMLALALIIPLAAGAYDLSIGANINVVTLLVVILQVDHHWSPVAAIVAGVLFGAAVGFVNGFIVVALRVNSFIATLGMSSILVALQVIIAPIQPSPVASGAYVTLATKSIGGFQIVFFYLLILAVLVWWFLEHTPVGRSLYAVGGNPEAARLTGIGVGRLTWMSFVASGTLTGIAGVFYGSQYGPSLTFGAALLLPAFAAAFLGSTQLKPGRVNVWGTIIAIYVLAIGVQGVQFVTAEQWVNSMFNGVALIGAVAFATWRQQSSGGPSRFRRWRKGPAEPGEPERDAASSPQHEISAGGQGVR
jgi:ribose transport system permease protein